MLRDISQTSNVALLTFGPRKRVFIKGGRSILSLIYFVKLFMDKPIKVKFKTIKDE
jgi:hypothetical protein